MAGFKKSAKAKSFTIFKCNKSKKILLVVYVFFVDQLEIDLVGCMHMKKLAS
jgi:hypothetical protein